MTIGVAKKRENLENIADKMVSQLWKCFLRITMIILMILCVACSDSVVEESNQDKETPDLGKILEDMIFIPAGDFLMGSPEGEGGYDEHPQHEVYLDEYYIDKYEVTNAQFQEFVEATGYVTDAEREGWGEVWNPKETSPYLTLHKFQGVNWRLPHAWRKGRLHPKSWKDYQFSDKMNYPVVQVSWNDVQAYATWAGKRLPTEAEWEKASRGTDGRKWPWGNMFDLNIGGATVHANIGSDGPMPVSCFPTGISPYGVYNMTGNVQEWTADWYKPSYYANSPKNNPKGPETGEFRAIRGGSWQQFESQHLLSASRMGKAPSYRSNFVGFRCAWSP